MGAFAPYAPPITFAALQLITPTGSGFVYRLTDLGVNGSLWVDNGGTNWSCLEPQIQISFPSLETGYLLVGSNQSQMQYTQTLTTVTVTYSAHGLTAAFNGMSVWLGAGNQSGITGWLTNFTYISSSQFSCTSTVSQSVVLTTVTAGTTATLPSTGTQQTFGNQSAGPYLFSGGSGGPFYPLFRKVNVNLKLQGKPTTSATKTCSFLNGSASMTTTATWERFNAEMNLIYGGYIVTPPIFSFGVTSTSLDVSGFYPGAGNPSWSPGFDASSYSLSTVTTSWVAVQASVYLVPF